MDMYEQRLEEFLLRLAKVHAPVVLESWPTLRTEPNALGLLARKLADFNILIITGEIIPTSQYVAEDTPRHLETWVKAYGEIYKAFVGAVFPNYDPNITGHYTDSQWPVIIYLRGAITPVIQMMADYIVPYVAVRQTEHSILPFELVGLADTIVAALEGEDLNLKARTQLQNSCVKHLNILLNSPIRQYPLMPGAPDLFINRDDSPKQPTRVEPALLKPESSDAKLKNNLRIFISYRKTNRNRVDDITQVLTSMGHTVNFDQDILQGQHWWDVIIEQIQKADLIIAMISPGYLQSQPCHLEYMYATALNKRILPVEIEPVNYRQIPVELQKIQMVDFERQDNDAIGRLTTALSVLPSSVPLPKVMPVIPEAPIPEISKLRDEVINLTLQIGPDRQRLIAMRLYEMMRGQNADDAKLARELLASMLKRPDITFSTGRTIENWLSIE
ncbi:MAG: toll/interleukin-1 receptor domain-containing protein [Anaerolineaceae bacterium]|nr:toll/interleukin-1 receptor domain-containing protein [Anaerolineaceae bacterium]